MPEALVLDTSAFLTLTDREPGAERVRELLKAAKRGEIQLHDRAKFGFDVEKLLGGVALAHGSSLEAL